MFNLPDESDDKKDVTISIGDIKKILNSNQFLTDGLDAIVDKLEELENRISKIEDYLNKD